MAIPLSGVYPTVVSAYESLRTCTGRIMAALLIITKRWRQPKCSSTSHVNEQVVVYPYNGVYATVKKSLWVGRGHEEMRAINVL